MRFLCSFLYLFNCVHGFRIGSSDVELGINEVEHDEDSVRSFEDQNESFKSQKGKFRSLDDTSQDENSGFFNIYKTECLSYHDVTNEEDEKKIQERLKNAARSHLQQQSHLINREHLLESMAKNGRPRVKRDFGVLTSPVATAVVTGMIGMTAKVVSDITTFRATPSSGGCEWFGTAPLCNYACPSDYDYVRGHNGRCSNFWLADTCKPDESFGGPCSTILGSFFKKRFCCKSDPNDCTWSGRWMGAMTAHNAYCRYDNNIGICGALKCSINHHELKAIDRTEITGENCDQLTLFNMTGSATCGFIAWSDSEGNAINSWYKTR